uniref:Uncharacterized protein n=1 Tax=Lotharella globosa TaxID=91324 RepID=A0A7S3Z3D3_9EUKA
MASRVETMATELPSQIKRNSLSSSSDTTRDPAQVIVSMIDIKKSTRMLLTLPPDPSARSISEHAGMMRLETGKEETTKNSEDLLSPRRDGAITTPKAGKAGAKTKKMAQEDRMTTADDKLLCRLQRGDGHGKALPGVDFEPHEMANNNVVSPASSMMEPANTEVTDVYLDASSCQGPPNMWAVEAKSTSTSTPVAARRLTPPLSHPRIRGTRGGQQRRGSLASTCATPTSAATSSTCCSAAVD